MAEGGGSPPSTPRESPPKAVIDTSPIHMDQNKESLKVKLLLRRPLDQLVAQGIMPPHKAPAAYHGQRRQLERAKTGDMLKAKIQQRPPRQELERRHILEADPAHVDPSLADKQRMLKKARLADQLNDQLSHRPGPLELIQKNILHTEEPIEQAVKTGRIPYKATSEGQINRPQHPSNYINPDEDSQSSEGDNIVSPGPSDVLETAAKSAGIVVSVLQPQEGTHVVVTSAAPALTKDSNSEIVFANICNATNLISQNSAASPASLLSSTSSLSPLSSVASPVPSVISQPATPIPVPPPQPITITQRSVIHSSKSDAPGKDKNRKKGKAKSVPKTRAIKFHEYKGPPSAHKNSSTNANSGETSYDLLLKQQTLLLQFQLQYQHKYPQIILPAQKSYAETSNTNNSSNHLNTQQPSPAPSTSSESSVAAATAAATRITSRLEDMKVSDLKAELKRRSLPVSGSKPQLIERLKQHSAGNGNNNNTTSTTTTNNNNIINNNTSNNESNETSSQNSMDQSHSSPKTEAGSPQAIKEEEKMEIGDPLSPAPSTNSQQSQQEPNFQCNGVTTKEKSNEDIVREQQRQIEELQRELTLSKMKLQAATRASSEPKAAQMLALQKHLQARQQQQQQQQQQNIALQLQALQARQAQINEEQLKLQQQQHVAFQNRKNLGGLVLNGANATLVFNQLLQNKAKVINGGNRANSLPNILNTIPIITTADFKNVAANEQEFDIKPPPLYEDATKKKNVKSQIVDDVLEILIKNGELPPSAANDPSTPGSAGSKSTEPIYPTASIPLLDGSGGNGSSGGTDDTLCLDSTELLDTLDCLDNCLDFNQLVMEFGGCQQPQQINPQHQQQQQESDNNNVVQSDESVPMDTDDWLDSLMPTNSSTFSNLSSNNSSSNTNNNNISNNNNNNNNPSLAPLATQEVDLNFDPLLGLTADPFDPFNLEEFRSPADLTTSLSWDKVDYAA